MRAAGSRLEQLPVAGRLPVDRTDFARNGGRDAAERICAITGDATLRARGIPGPEPP